MKLPATFWRGFWWKLGAALALLVLSYVMPGKAHAQTAVPGHGACKTEPNRPNEYRCHTQPAALALANDGRFLCDANGYTNTTPELTANYPKYQSGTDPNYIYNFTCKSPAPFPSYLISGYVWIKPITCPAGQVFDTVTNQCGPPNQCGTKPSLNNVLAVRTSTSGAACINGCFYKPSESVQTGSFQFNLQSPGGLQFVHEGAAVWDPTGAQCGQADENKPYDPTKPVCTQQGSLTQCVQPDGKFCATASTGKRICWNPGETGQKQTLDGSLAGDRQKAPGTPGVTGIEGGNTANSQTSVNNTTYNNEFKEGGSPSGTSQSNTGEGGSENPDGSDKDEGDDGSASGGGSCAAPPSCSGDAINCAVLDQQWRTRCANDKNDDGQPDWTEGDKPSGEGEGSDGNVGEGAYKRFGLSLGTDRLDTDNIFGGGSCPTFSMEVMGFAASTADIPAWCDIAAVMRAVVLIMGAYMALQILLGRI